ncbi:pig-Q [Coemansia erecta]|uniref:Pig-Q n=1 Tax=Coemansia erecta TaxID=147472 RepID=A0A9W7XZY9_9FUNG|nr:pig-Q [Coemansia erecta]
MTMPEPSGAGAAEHIFKVFWPMHLCKPAAESGYLVGWNLGRGSMVVASQASHASAEQISGYLAEYHRQAAGTHTPAAGSRGDGPGRRFWSPLARPPLQPPGIVGYLSREGEGLCEHDVRDACDVWVDAFTARTQVAFRAIRCHGNALPARVILILYEESADKPWHFYTASPISLDLTTLDSGDCAQAVELAVSPDDQNGPPLQHVLDHINATGQLYMFLEGSAGSNDLQATLPPNAAAENTAKPGAAAGHPAVIALVYSLLVRLSEYSRRALDVDFFDGKLKDFSAVIQQLNLIVRRKTYLIEQWGASYYTRRPANGRRHNAQYASFWNSAWVIALDLMLGCLVGIYLVMHARWVSEFMLTTLRKHTVTSLEQTIDWLRRWPAGLKLNNGLDGFLAELFLWLIHFWTVIFQPFTRCLRIVVIVAGWSGFVGGCSMQLAILSDTLTLATLHTYWFYMVATRIFHWQQVTLYSLFNLFRGRKHNVLRNRIDSCDYGLDQLLIGTILFTLLTYLFPTVLVYYVMFVSRRLAVIMAQGLLEILLVILNHCPIFYMVLRLGDPHMFPGGVSYDVNCRTARRFIEAAWVLPGAPVHLSRDPIPLSARNRLNVTVVQMNQVPMPFEAIFFQYYHVWSQFSASYLSLGLLRSLVVGDVIRPVPRLQHTMIPGLSSSPSSASSRSDHVPVQDAAAFGGQSADASDRIKSE